MHTYQGCSCLVCDTLYSQKTADILKCVSSVNSGNLQLDKTANHPKK